MYTIPVLIRKKVGNKHKDNVIYYKYNIIMEKSIYTVQKRSNISNKHRNVVYILLYIIIIGKILFQKWKNIHRNVVHTKPIYNRKMYCFEKGK